MDYGKLEVLFSYDEPGMKETFFLAACSPGDASGIRRETLRFFFTRIG
ncbi:MAG: hypothetical protein ACE5QV_06770 [Fidelibacterota bacterium]